jgi:hypothetical protein
MKTLSRVMEAHPGVVEAYPGAGEAHLAGEGGGRV